MSITQAHKGSHQIVRSDQALPYATMQSSSLLTKRGTLWGQRAVGAKPVVLSNPSIVLRPLAATGHGGSNNFDSILAKYSSGGPPSPAPKGSVRRSHDAPSAARSNSVVLHCGKGLAALILVNAGVYAAAVWGGHTASVASMVLPAIGAKWWQWVTSAFVHASAEHVARNCAVLWLAGSAAGRELGGVGTWFAYLVCALGANVSAAMLMPAKVKAAGGLLGVAATGGTVGIAAAALMLGLRPSLGYVCAAAAFMHLALTPLLAMPVPGGPSAALPLPHTLWGAVVGGGWREVVATVRGATADPGLTWLWGALAGAAVVVLLARVPDSPGPSTPALP